MTTKKQGTPKDEVMEAFERFDLTMTSDGKVEVVMAKEHPDMLGLYDIDLFISRYRDDCNIEKLTELIKQLSAIKDACDGAIYQILGIDF